ncbi:centromere protein U [Ctenodactylus gundi]
MHSSTERVIEEFMNLYWAILKAVLRLPVAHRLQVGQVCKRTSERSSAGLGGSSVAREAREPRYGLAAGGVDVRACRVSAADPLGAGPVPALSSSPASVFAPHNLFLLPMKAGERQKPTDVFDFPNNSEISSIGRLGENEKDEEPYETFDPPLHSTAIYADDEEFSKHCGSSIPSTPQGEGRKSSNTSENEASENDSVKIRAEKPRNKLKPLSDGSESTEEGDVRRNVKLVEKVSMQQCKAVPAGPSSELAERPCDPLTPRSTRPCGAQAPVEKDTRAAQRQAAQNSSDSVHIWCLEGRKSSDIMELDIVLSAFEKTVLEYKQGIESKICKEAIDKFYFSIKEELIRMIKEVQTLQNLKRKNAKMISTIKRKRQCLLEVQDELLRLEPQLKQLQTQYDELQKRKAALKNATCFLSNLKQLYQDYSDVQEEEPNVKETYDSSSIPALLFKARPLLGAENHLQNINHQLAKLLGDESEQSTERCL